MPIEKSGLSALCEQSHHVAGDYCTSLQSKKSAMRMLHPDENLSLSEYGCRLSIATISAVTKTNKMELQAGSRSTAAIALARQTAMYLAHTKFGITYAEVGVYFKRDRSTVAHACRLIEDRRDNEEFDDSLCRMENLVDAALRGSFIVQQFANLGAENYK